MKIAIDARYIERQGSGLSVYTSNMITQLRKKDEIDLFTIVTNDQITFLPKIEKSRQILSPHPLQKHPAQEWWMAFGLPRLLAENSIDILLCPSFIVPLKKLDVKVCTVIQDLAFHYASDSMDKKFASYASFMTRMAVKNSDLILTTTHAVLDEVVKKYKIPKNKIGFAHLGINPHTKKNDALEKDRLGQLGIDSPYFLFVANIEPRKDIARLIELFQEIRLNKSFTDHKLVLCGKKRWHWDKIKSQIQSNENAIFTGFLEQAKIDLLYQNSEAIFATSKYEGFGLPVIEGMQTEKVVFASNIPPFKEVAKDGAVFINLDNIKESSKMVLETLGDQSKKAAVLDEARKRIEDFSWQKTADKTVEILRKLQKSNK